MSFLLAGIIPNPPERPGPTPGYTRRGAWRDLATFVPAPKPPLEGTMHGYLRVDALLVTWRNGGRKWRCTCLAPSGKSGAPCGKRADVSEKNLGKMRHGQSCCGDPRCKIFVRRLRKAEETAAAAP